MSIVIDISNFDALIGLLGFIFSLLSWAKSK